MNRYHIFPWREEERAYGSPVLRPTVDVTLRCGDLDVVTKALIDTGAPRTVFPRGIADILGIELPPSYTPGLRKVELLGHTWPTFSETVRLQLDQFEDMGWEAEVDFVLDEGLDFGLFGYEGFLNHWAVSFDGYHGFFVVEPVESFNARIPVDPWEEFQERWPDSYNP